MPVKHLDILLLALNSPKGVKVNTNNPTRLRAELYSSLREIKSQGDDTFSSISLHLSPFTPDSCLWLSKKESKNGTPPKA